MTESSLINQFLQHVGQTLRMLQYSLIMQRTFPLVMIQLKPEQLKTLTPVIHEWIDFCREIYELPDLGTKPPDPMPVDPNCPEHLLSDHIRERIGKNAPFFDFVNAPFTHPIGTQISVTCITSAWNAYDTFINGTIAELKTMFPDDARIKQLLAKEAEAAEARKAGADVYVSTDEKLKILSLLPSQADMLLVATVNQVGDTHFNPDKTELLLRAGKDIRTAFTHRFGRPTDRLNRIMKEESFEDFGFRMHGDELEVALFGARNMLEVIQLRAVTIDRKKSGWYLARTTAATATES